jgi:ferrous iron transport protein A
MSGHVLARFGDPVLPEADAARVTQDGAPAGVRAPVETGFDATGHESRSLVPLTSLARHATGVVAGVRVAPAGAKAQAAHDPALERMALRLIEIGFVQGAHVRVIAFGQPGSDPIGVRVGGRGGVSTFALRRQEAACVWIWAD